MEINPVIVWLVLIAVALLLLVLVVPDSIKDAGGGLGGLWSDGLSGFSD